MRRYAFIKDSNINTNIKKVMIYECYEWIYVFVYDTIEDKSCNWDYWFEITEEALLFCKESFWITDEDWINIEDPKDWCYHDIIENKKIIHF